MNKYVLITAWNDGTTKTERADLASILRAAAIYYEHPDLFAIHVRAVTTGEEVVTIYK